MNNPITASSWHHLPMPPENAHFILEKEISFKNYEILKRGYLPQTPADQWFTYFENDKLYINRSVSGFCIYIVNLLPEERFMHVIVNRNPRQYVITDVEQDKFLLNDLLDILIRFGGLVRQRELIAAKKNRKQKQQQDQANLEQRIWG